MASVAPAYFVWITPELFNFSLVMLGYFCWLYKEVADAGVGAARHAAGCFRPGSRSRGRRAARRGDVLEAVQPAPDPPAARVAAREAPVAAARRSPASSSASSAAVLLAGNVADHGRLELPGRRPPRRSTGRTRSRSAACRGRRSGRTGRRTGADRTSSSTGASSGRSSRTTSRTSSSAATRGCCRTSSPASSRIVAFLLARGKRAPGSGSSSAAAAAQILLLLRLGPVHVQRRRRFDREPLLHEHLRRVPVPAAADHVGRAGRSSRGSWAASSRRR